MSDLPKIQWDDQVKWDAPGKGFWNDTADTARIAGTGALRGVANFGDMASSIMGPPPVDVAKLTGFTPLALRKGGTKAGLERLGLPSDPEAEAKRLGAEYTPLRRSLASAAKIGTEAALMGAGAGPSALAAIGAGTGQAVGGDTGELIGSMAAPLGVLAASRGLGARTAARSVPTTEELGARASQAYRDAENAGVIISQRALGRLEAGIQGDMARQGMDATLHPRVTAAMNRLSDDAARGHMTLEGADILRRVMRNAASSADASERRLAMRMVGRLDDFIGNLRPTDIVQGDLNGVLRLQQARNLWSRSAKSETISDAIERATTRAGQYSVAGRDNALRVEFGQIANNPRRMRLFNDAEQAAILRVARTGNLQGALRGLGKFNIRSVIGGPVGAGLGYATLGPVGAGAALGIAEGSRLGSALIRTRNARLAETLMRRGGPAPSRPLTPLDRAALNAILVGGAAASSE